METTTGGEIAAEGENSLYITNQNDDTPAEISSPQTQSKDPSLNNDDRLEEIDSSGSVIVNADESNQSQLANLTISDYSVGTPTSTEVKVSLYNIHKNGK